MESDERVVELGGSDSALVSAALFALAEWPFETARAKSLLNDEHKAAWQKVSEAVSARWRELLGAEGYWSPGQRWTRDLIAKRAALKRGLSLSAAELPVAVLALKAVAEEFTSNWDEFCTVVPGAIDLYPVGPEDVPRLALRLESNLIQ
jgi:hypothetical protein